MLHLREKRESRKDHPEMPNIQLFDYHFHQSLLRTNSENQGYENDVTGLISEDSESMSLSFLGGKLWHAIRTSPPSR